MPYITSAEGEPVAQVGLFGYDSVEVHMQWRETERHAQVIEGMEVLAKEEGLKMAEVLGRDIFHVKFERNR